MLYPRGYTPWCRCQQLAALKELKYLSEQDLKRKQAEKERADKDKAVAIKERVESCEI